MATELQTPFSIISGVMRHKISPGTLLDVFLISNSLKGFGCDKIMGFKKEMVPTENDPQKKASDQTPNAKLKEFIANYAVKYNLLHTIKIPEASFFTNNEDFFQKPPKIFKNNISCIT